MLYHHLITTKQFKEALNCAEQEIYMEAYKYTSYNQVKTSKLLGVARGTLRTKLKKWDKLVSVIHDNRRMC